MKYIHHLLFAAFIIVAISCGRHNVAATKEKIPFIAGTWFENGDTSLGRFIVQNQTDVIFMRYNQTSTGYFQNSYRIVLKDWNTSVVLSDDEKTIKWNDRTWTKGTFSYSDISGDWFENAEAKKKIYISQDGARLTFDNGNSKADAYFYATNAIYSPTWNKYATYNPQTKTLVWGQASWFRKAIK